MMTLFRFNMVYFFFLVLLGPMLVSYETLTADQSILVYIIAPVSCLLLLPVIKFQQQNFNLSDRVMIFIGQGFEAFGMLVMTGNVTWLNKGYMIAGTGIGCICVGISQAIV